MKTEKTSAKEARDQATKCELSLILEKMQDGSLESILRDIIFSGNNTIDWDEALKSIRTRRPETTIK